MRAMDEDEDVRLRWCVIREGEKTGDPTYGVTVWRPSLTIHITLIFTGYRLGALAASPHLDLTRVTTTW